MNTTADDQSGDMSHWKPQEKSIFKFFLMYFIPLFIILTISLAGLIVGDYLRTSKLINANERLQISIIKKTLTHDLAEIGPDLRILMQSENFQDYLSAPGPTTKKDLQKTFSLFANYRRVYSQIRYIDLNGMEKVRIDFDNSRVIHAPDAQLQNKSARYYFKESIQLERGDIFVSPLDLNIENDEIEKPYKPVIRFATPVFDANGKKRGIIILNYLAQRIF